ncbi:hypothetical protein [Dactylosporangium sp. NPDC048998]|uniref:hypothetical protein n=1 Tax=Dactylosporangium sp. NPDC048998 TaxID=3363976 RepID=UPI00371AA29A
MTSRSAGSSSATSTVWPRPGGRAVPPEASARGSASLAGNRIVIVVPTGSE